MHNISFSTELPLAWLENAWLVLEVVVGPALLGQLKERWAVVTICSFLGSRNQNVDFCRAGGGRHNPSMNVRRDVKLSLFSAAIRCSR